MGDEKTIKKIPINKIVTEAGTQMRISFDEETVEEYAEDMKNGDEFPHLIVFSGNGKYYLADGFHRLEAAKRAKKRSISCEVKTGRLRDAKLFAASANTKHGLKRTREDKRNAVEALLKDKEWSQWGNREIARHCKVDHKTVGKIRKELSGEIPRSEKRKVRRGDTVYEQDSTNIGKNQKRKSSGDFPRSEITFKKPIEKKLNTLCNSLGIDRMEAIEQALEIMFQLQSIGNSKKRKK